MFSPRQSASFIESKIVSIVASACFWVTPRFTTRMLMRSDLSIWTPAGTRPLDVENCSGCKKPSRSFRNQQGIHGDAQPHPAWPPKSGGLNRLSARLLGCRRRGRALTLRATPVAIAQTSEGDVAEPLRSLVFHPLHDRRDEAGARRDGRLLPAERPPDIEERDLLERTPGDETRVGERHDDSGRLERPERLAHVVRCRADLVCDIPRVGGGRARVERTRDDEEGTPGEDLPGRLRRRLRPVDERRTVLEHEREARAEEEDRPRDPQPEEEDRDRRDRAVDGVRAEGPRDEGGVAPLRELPRDARDERRRHRVPEPHLRVRDDDVDDREERAGEERPRRRAEEAEPGAREERARRVPHHD